MERQDQENTKYVLFHNNTKIMSMLHHPAIAKANTTWEYYVPQIINRLRWRTFGEEIALTKTAYTTYMVVYGNTIIVLEPKLTFVQTIFWTKCPSKIILKYMVVLTNYINV